MRKLLLLLIFLLAACAPALTQPASIDTAYTTEPSPSPAPSPTFTPNVLVVIETPVPTSTPLVYAIQSGDTFSELAEQFKISQDELPDAFDSRLFIRCPKRSDAHARACSCYPNRLPPDSG